MKRTVVLPCGLIEDLQRQRRECLPRETGGFLLGLRRGPHLDVTRATRQVEGDVALPYSFHRTGIGHGATAVAQWEASDGYVTIVGDWHSHPYGPPDPSGTDRTAWRDLSRSVRGPVVGIIIADGQPGIYFIQDGLFRSSVVRLEQVDRTSVGIAYA